MDSDDDSDAHDDGSRSSESSIDEEEEFNALLAKIKENDPSRTMLSADGRGDEIQNRTNEDWEELGRDISNNSHLQTVSLYRGALDDQKMSFLFRGLTRSSSIETMNLYENELSVAAVRSMVPFLQNTNNLTHLDLDENNLQSEGFDLIFRALSDGPIETLYCCDCGIESIEIDSEHMPKHLERLHLNANNFSNDGCRELAKLLRSDRATLEFLFLSRNKIADDGVEVLVSALKNNTSLKRLGLRDNDGISKRGQIMLLKLVNDVSSIKATLQSNYTLTDICVKEFDPEVTVDAYEIQRHINMATSINNHHHYRNHPETVGRGKLIHTQLDSATREELYRLQEVDHSVYREIDPLHLPEVLSLIGRYHGQGELYLGLLSTIMSLLSTMNMAAFIEKGRAYHAAKAAEHAAKAAKHEAVAAEHRIKMEELDARLVSTGGASEGKEDNDQFEHRSSKRPRKWWWGFWGEA